MPNYDSLMSPGVFTNPGGYGPTSTASPATSPSLTADQIDYPVFNLTKGGLVSMKTGQPWMGAMPSGWSNPAGGSTPTGGVQVPYAPAGTTINPNNPAQRYSPVTIPKNPDIVAGEQNLMKTFQDSAANSLQDFSAYLKNFTSDLSGSRAAGASALDITPTVNALQGGQAQYAAGLTADQNQLSSLLGSNAAAEQGVVQQVQNTLPQYDAAAKAVADQQMAAVNQQLSRYKMGTGTPSSGGSDEQRILADAAAKVYAPFEQAKIAEQQNILTGLALPVQQDITNRATAALTQFDPAAQAAIWSSGRATAQDVQSLKNAVATMSYQQAVQFMTALGVPAQVMQGILSGQIGQLGQLSQIEQGANYQGIQDRLGVYQSQPVGYSNATPGIPNYGVRSPTNSTNSLAPAATAPITIGPSGAPSTPFASPYGPPAGTTSGLNPSGQPVYNAPGLPNYFGLPITNQNPNQYLSPSYPAGDVSIPSYSGMA